MAVEQEAEPGPVRGAEVAPAVVALLAAAMATRGQAALVVASAAALGALARPVARPAVKGLKLRLLCPAPPLEQLQVAARRNQSASRT